MNYTLQTLKAGIKICLILTLATIFIHMFRVGGFEWDSFKYSIFYNFYYGLPLSFANGLLHDYLNEKIPWETSTKLRALTGFFGSLVITMVVLVILNYLLWVLINGNDSSVVFAQKNRMFYIVALLITVIISSVIHAIAFFKEIQSEKLKSEKLKKEVMSSELNALKAHIDPHFLFNSFNTLSGLIDEDTKQAQAFLKGLSKIYRYILENRNQQINSIRSEVDFASAYLALHQTRFEDSIFLSNEFSESKEDKKIASLSLQLLLENAVKHNSFDDSNPLQISIKEEAGFLVVENNVKARTNLRTGKSVGMGIQNIKDRYELLTDRKVIVENSNGTFKVKLPIL